MYKVLWLENMHYIEWISQGVQLRNKATHIAWQSNVAICNNCTHNVMVYKYNIDSQTR